MPDKPTVAFYWCAGCGGCEESVVDLAEKILDVVNAVNIGFWPVALDFKKSDVEQVPDGYFAASFINGSVRTSEHEEMVTLLRRKSKLLFAYGACAHLGGIPGLANLTTREEIMNYAYVQSPSTDNPQKVFPSTHCEVDGMKLELPEFYKRVFALDQVTGVDYYIPGCAPPPDVVINAFTALLKGELPPRGTVLSPGKAQCSACPLNETKPEKLMITELKRPHQTMIDPDKCFLLQGLICMGPATRSGCGEMCIKGGMPCRGCFGPPDNVFDQGLSMLSALGSILDYPPDQEIELDKLLERLHDPAGTFYRFSAPTSLFFKGK